MRKWGIVAALMAVVLICPSAFGAALSYGPAQYLTIPAGYSQSMPVSLTLKYGEGLGTMYFSFVDYVDGDIPTEWISASPETAFISEFWPTTYTTLKISVPEGVPVSTYSGYIFPSITFSHRMNLAEAVYVELFVPASCTGKPEVEITSFGPDVIMPPNKGPRVISVSGNVVVPEGCTIYEAGYGIEDEYGEYSGVVTIDLGPEGGSFRADIEVSSYRGKDKDGRDYNIMFYAEDEMGIGVSETLKAIVPHGEGKGKIR